MNSWRDAILNEFVPNVSKLTLVADPDGLLTEEKLALALRQRGFDLIEFADSIEFRYAYESHYRSLWDKNQPTDLVVILRTPDSKLDLLPYDLLCAGRKLAFDLGGLFPNLSYAVVEKLERSLLDPLFDAQRRSSPDRMGDNATKEFVLRHVFGIEASVIAGEVDLLRALLSLHYRKTIMPKMLTDRLLQILADNPIFDTWPLAKIVPDADAFFGFLQERWPLFLSTLEAPDMMQDDHAGYFVYPGPALLPFGHHDIRVFLDNLFVEGRLKPFEPTLSHLTAWADQDVSILKAHPWIRCGIAAGKADDDMVRVTRLFELVAKSLPSLESRHSDWLVFAQKWAELTARVQCRVETSEHERLREIGGRLNTSFTQWLNAHYASLINLPPTQPAMLHHLPRRLARDREEMPSRNVAMIVVDGLALSQWVTIRNVLQEQVFGHIFRESATFAWIPTITSVSRQAIFAGKPPIYFPASIHVTHNEGNLWRQFWESNGLARQEIFYQRGLGDLPLDGNVATILDGAFCLGKTKAVGLVVDKVDKIMHGMQLGASGMHNQLKQWCQGGFLGALINLLLDHGYEVWITSDHGNVECNGKGSPAEGAIADLRGERVRVYPTPELRERVARQFSFAHPWVPVGLPPDYYPLIAAGDDSFLNPSETVVGHGGISIEEVIVPLVKIEPRGQL